MPKTKGPQFYLDHDLPAESALIDYFNSKPKGDKAELVKRMLLVGQALEEIDWRLFEILSSTVRRGEKLDAETLIEIVALFALKKSDSESVKSHSESIKSEVESNKIQKDSNQSKSESDLDKTKSMGNFLDIGT